ncbi:sensor histidine kinase [Allonocardiopsis opalescens]|uniref:Anti-sigma regulatory factor (Ser/Thr protein kinase) n=1 Tax=Allonocardiopsis opalescens TaxID=1144618 RepID=A0A2T0Q4X6_9ACTN|nr:sensor histidine kinase [Allonocardiopsis opalescens]PRX98830.1 anti-sigma regulatory factor (Ser/Thr protein kinase) [Allonocardiopsis opalescens]
MPALARPATTGPFTHRAVFYSGARQYTDAVLPFVRAGLAAGDPVLVAVPGPRLDMVQAALGGDAKRVTLVDMALAGRNPGRIIPWLLHDFITGAAACGRPRIVGEPVWAGRPEREYPACVQYEALVNRAFADRPATVLCPYDAGRLPRRVLADAHRTHPDVVNALPETRTAAYQGPEEVLAAFNLPLPEPSSAPTVLDFARDDLPELRRLVTSRAERWGISGDRIDDLVLAVSELAANSVEHAGGGGTLRLWRDGGGLVCEVRDGGRFADPLAGRIPPPPTRPRGRGLLLVHHLCDLVRLHADARGTTIQIHIAAD